MTVAASSTHAPPYTISPRPGRGADPASSADPAAAITQDTATSGHSRARPPGIRAANSASRDRPVATRSRNTPACRSPAPMVAPTSTAVTVPSIDSM